jgi:hypothetical protein
MQTGARTRRASSPVLASAAGGADHPPHLKAAGTPAALLAVPAAAAAVGWSWLPLCPQLAHWLPAVSLMPWPGLPVAAAARRRCSLLLGCSLPTLTWPSFLLPRHTYAQAKKQHRHV